MNRLWHQAEKIPKHVRIGEIIVRMFLLRVNKILSTTTLFLRANFKNTWKFQRITDEENRRVISHHVPVAFFSVKLERKAARISSRVCTSLFSSHRAEPQKHRGSFSNPVEKLGSGEAREIMRNLKVTMRSCTFGMNHSFGNALSIKMR